MFTFSNEFKQAVRMEYGEDFSEYLNESLENPGKGYEFIRTFLGESKNQPTWELVLESNAMELKLEADRRLRRQALHTRCLQERSVYANYQIRGNMTAS